MAGWRAGGGALGVCSLACLRGKMMSVEQLPAG